MAALDHEHGHGAKAFVERARQRGGAGRAIVLPLWHGWRITGPREHQHRVAGMQGRRQALRADGRDRTATGKDACRLVHGPQGIVRHAHVLCLNGHELVYCLAGIINTGHPS